MKRKNSWREEPYWHWAWPYAEESPPQYAHMAHVIESNEQGGALKAGIYLPDPDSRSGWQVHPIYSDPPPPPEKRRIGL